MKQIKALILLALTSMAFVACNNSNGNNGGTAAVHSYGYQNGTCWDYTANTPAPNYSMCTAGINNNGNYVYQNGNCYARTNMYTPVAPQLCQNGGVNGGVISKQCNGAYIWPQDGSQRFCTANYQINNCQGYMMTEMATGQNVQCI